MYLNNNNITVVKTIASPQSVPNIGGKPLPKKIEVGVLFQEIIKILENNGEELLADNILFQCNKLGRFSKAIIEKQRAYTANKVISKYSLITSGVIFINPLPVTDLLAATTVNIQMIIEISKIYGFKLSRNEAIQLSKSIISVITTLGIVKGGINIISNLLSADFTTIFIKKSIQSLTAAWIIKIVGQSFIRYFENNQNWGDGGITEVVQDLYEINKREEILKNFLKDAVLKISNYKSVSLKKKLPPYSQSDY